MRRILRPVLLLLAALLPLRSAAADTSAVVPLELARLPAEIRALVPLADGALVAGMLAGERAFAARLADGFTVRWQRSFDACGRCGFLDARALDPERAVLVGYRDPERAGREDGLVVVLDLRTGAILSERMVLTPSGGRLWAVDVASSQLFAAGEAWTHAGAGLDPWVLALRLADLAPLREWYPGGPLPDASSDVHATEAGAVAVGWTLSPKGGTLGGWIAHFGEGREPLWRHENAAEAGRAFDVAAIAPLADGGWLAAGHTSAADAHSHARTVDFRFLRLAADGTLVAFGGLHDATTDRMVVDLLADGPDTARRLLAVVAARPHPNGADALELVAIDPERATAAPGLRWRDGSRATVPDVAAHAPDGTLLVGGWYRDPPAGEMHRGWLIRLHPEPLPAGR